MNGRHTEIVSRLANQVKAFYENKIPFRIYHGSTNSTRVLTFSRDKMLDVSMLDKVISIDDHTCTAIVEPNVPMDRLLGETNYWLH